MKTTFVRQFLRLPVPALLLTLVVFAACGGDKEVGADVLKGIKPGMPRAEVLQVIGQGTMTGKGSDSVRVVNGRRHSRFFSNGRNIEVIYYRDKAGEVTELVEQNQETPVVLLEDKALGWGWKFYVESMKTYNLPSPIYEKPTKPTLPAPTTAAKPDSSKQANADSVKQAKPLKP
jgi:hypothetical protein